MADSDTVGKDPGVAGGFIPAPTSALKGTVYHFLNSGSFFFLLHLSGINLVTQLNSVSNSGSDILQWQIFSFFTTNIFFLTFFLTQNMSF